MQKLPIIGVKLRSLLDRRKASVSLARIRQHHLAEAEQEEHCLDAMRPWRDPVEQTRTVDHEQRRLLEDDPPSG